MSRLRAVVAALTLGVPFVATAADVTRVASSFEDEDPFGMFIDVGIEHSQRRTKIVREALPTTAGATRQYQGELWYRSYDTRLNLDVAFGIAQDVELSFGLPIVLLQDESWAFVSGTNPGNSTITNNFVRNNCGGSGAPCSLTSPEPLFNMPAQGFFETFRGGLGNARFGFAWSIFNQRKDETKPTWTVGLDYEAPTAKLLDPSFVTSKEDRGPVGDRVHKYTVSTALSRQIGLAEPYFRMHYTIPVRGPGAWTNCNNRNVDPQNLGHPQNCGAPGWERKETGIQAPHVAGVMFGSEFQVLDTPTRKFKLDLRAMSNYVSEGRYYNELSGPLRKLLATGDYIQIGGQFALTAQLSDFLSVRGSGMYLYNTDHVLTDEKIGRDVDGNGSVDITMNPSELNPNFDYRTDFVSRRFLATESKDFRLDVSATLRF
ncbi:hypothetical protein ATI61_115105 [Archangium gephyra]|uniref:Porin n=1 Tax=Archangium gephyra TaxID=48 RepID=A0AAC8Q978_9BACT|nr:hypothetical protein [Archangium gephyra]AKJ03430.1 Hypothetical protein AA314_05056 [Archangium gephyra]REG24063.1 hypothetical protein ATI61_115105 [Archangium gephyra]